MLIRASPGDLKLRLRITAKNILLVENNCKHLLAKSPNDGWPRASAVVRRKLLIAGRLGSDPRQATS